MNTEDIIKEIFKNHGFHKGSDSDNKAQQIIYEWELPEVIELIQKLSLPSNEEKREVRVCYKDGKPCKYDCKGLCKESC